jgi:hypothetical protein
MNSFCDRHPWRLDPPGSPKNHSIHWHNQLLGICGSTASTAMNFYESNLWINMTKVNAGKPMKPLCFFSNGDLGLISRVPQPHIQHIQTIFKPIYSLWQGSGVSQTSSNGRFTPGHARTYQAPGSCTTAVSRPSSAAATNWTKIGSWRKKK